MNSSSILRSIRPVGSSLLQQATPRLYSPATTLLHARTNRAAYSSVADQPQTAIVTGAARGIGRAIALRLASDGYDVCVNDLDIVRAECDELVKEIRGMGRKACTVIADVRKRHEVADLVKKSVRELGPLRTMIANAGISGARDLLQISEDEFQNMFAVNVSGTQNSFAEGAKQLISQGTCRPDRPGKLLAASSIAGFKAYALLGHYASSKWAVRGLMQAYSIEMAPHNITANAYAPGIVDTQIWDNMKPGMAQSMGLPTEQLIGVMAESLTAMKRLGTPEDIAKMVSFLASEDSNFVTGQTQLVDGGIHFT
ncbi:hypothetical protein GGS21DRAFT_135198 [Xylaria nigripes]|nr:hypothetical protein GGS21DRAFT_135198 [Xylaria nigripes]